MYKHSKFLKYFTIAILFALNTITMASDERVRIGVVKEISNNRIELDLPTGNISMIGFSCELEVCNTLKRISVGDKVILKLGSENNKNKLNSIRKCSQNDKECQKAKMLVIKKHKEWEEASRKAEAEYSSCRESMNKNLLNNKHYIPNNRQINNSESVLLKYNKHITNPTTKICLEKVVRSHQKSIYESCIKYECGKNIGGGCSHIVGYSITNSVLAIALEKCGI